MHSLVRCERCEAEKGGELFGAPPGRAALLSPQPGERRSAAKKGAGLSFALASLVERSGGLEEPAVSALLDFYAEQGLAGPHESGEGVWLCFRPKQVLYYRHRLEILELEAIGP